MSRLIYCHAVRCLSLTVRGHSFRGLLTSLGSLLAFFLSHFTSATKFLSRFLFRFAHFIDYLYHVLTKFCFLLMYICTVDKLDLVDI